MSSAAEKPNVNSRLESLSPAQRALLEQRLMQRQTVVARENRISRRTGDGPAPLSYAQELLWLLSQVFDDGIAYNAPGAFRLEGSLDLELLARALTALVERHEILRTTYTVIDGTPMQTVGPTTPAEINLVDLRGTPDEEREAAAQAVLKEEARFRFDLVNGPVMRTTVIRLSNDQSILMINMHHVATDGYSRSAIYRDLTALYEAFGKDLPSPLPPLAIQYADYAVWQRTWLDGGIAGAQLEYWKRKLARAPSRLELPTDFPRPAVRSDVGSNMRLMFDVPTREGLRATARRADSTLFVALLTVLSALLSRYSGQDDIVLGTPFAGRNRTELESMVGYFINPLALRIDLSGDPTFLELLGRARETTLEAFANADVPYETVVRATNPQRDLSQTPVFQAMVVFHNPAWQTQRPKFQPEGIRCTEITHEKGWSKFDVLVGMSERANGLNTTWEYSTDLFKAPTVARMMAHFRALAESVVSNPDRRLSRLPMLSDGERTKVLIEWNADRQPLPERASIKELFEEQVASTPAAPAVVFEQERLSFEQLNARANRIAWKLRSEGVGPGTLVGILMEKSIDLVPAVLGVVKAGGTYIPLDPMYPGERIEFMVADSNPAVLLTRAKHLESLPATDATVLAVDSPGALDGMDEENPPSVAGPEDLAYVIYTSGSTGKPKGAMIANRSLVSAHFAYERAYRLRELTAHAQMASFSFDVFTGDMIRSLLAGAKLVLCPIETIVDPAALHRLMLEEGIDAAEFVPATATLLFEYLQSAGKSLDHMRLVIVSSEAWTNEKCKFFMSLCGPQTRLLNAYGLTEATIDSTWFEPPPDAELQPGRFVPIGKPLENTNIYILDANLEPQPIGIPGELCVGGVAVARGYLNRPELTAEKFVADPFCEEPGALLYRTGDSARWLADGTIDFLGRTDRQIKIRGFRIEPGEIETVLEGHPAIRAAAVVDRLDSRGETRLVAYIDADEPAPETADLRALLADHVPNYMIPSSYVKVDELPITPNGKVDRDALPEPEWEQESATEEFIAPRTAAERGIAEIWSSVLSVNDVGIHDDFFALGGHSLLAVRLFAEIERKLGVRLPISALFESPTLAALAELVERERGGETLDWSGLVRMRAGDGQAPLFLVSYAGGDVLPYRELVESLTPGLPVYGLHAPGVDRRTLPLASVEELAAHYVEQVRAAQPHGPYRLGGFCFSGIVAYEMARLLLEDGEELELLALIDAFPWRPRPTHGVIEHERIKLRAFREADLRGKVAWLPGRVGGLGRRVRARTYERYGPRLYELAQSRELEHLIPRRPLNLVLIASNLARRRYVPRPLDVRVEFYRAQNAPGADPTPWDGLAGRGVALQQIVAPDIDHERMMEQPYVRLLAAEIARALENAGS
jgi:amino acid adenylation domain-containing protein